MPIQTLLFFTALSFLPAVLLLMTGFTRIVIVLSLLRQALGTQSAPPNQVVVGLSLFLTLFVMGPTLDKVYQDAYAPYTANQISFEQALERGQEPMRAFMLKQTRQSDFELFAKLAKLPAETVLRGVVSTMGGGEGMAVLEQQVAKIPATGGWRLVFKVPKPDGAALELRGFLELGGRTLTETWTYTLEP